MSEHFKGMGAISKGLDDAPLNSEITLSVEPSNDGETVTMWMFQTKKNMHMAHHAKIELSLSEAGQLGAQLMLLSKFTGDSN